MIFPPGDGKSVLCVGGRSDLDDVTASMLAQTLWIQGADAAHATHEVLKAGNIKALQLEGRNAVVLSVLDQDFMRHAKFTVRRLKRIAPAARVGIVLWKEDGRPGTTERDQLIESLQADFVVFGMGDAVREALSDELPRSLKLAHPKIAPGYAMRRSKRTDTESTVKAD